MVLHRVDGLNCRVREGQRIGAIVAIHPYLPTPSLHFNRSLGDLNVHSNLRTGFEERLWHLVGNGTGGGKERKGGAPWDLRFPA